MERFEITAHVFRSDGTRTDSVVREYPATMTMAEAMEDIDHFAFQIAGADSVSYETLNGQVARLGPGEKRRDDSFLPDDAW